MAILEDYLRPPVPAVPTATSPPADEAHLPWWRGIAAEVDAGRPLLARLRRDLPQLRLAIREGISRTRAYAALVREARPLESLSPEEVGSEDLAPEDLDEVFEDPASIRLEIAEHPAGALPVLHLGARADFVRAFRALGARAEPIDVPPGVRALYVSGLPNPGRLRARRDEFLARGGGAESWSEELERLAAEDRTHLHDRLILLSPGGYGDADRWWRRHGLDEPTWIDRSGAIRLEHELAHHATQRLLGSHRLNLLDELAADFMGFTKALGGFDATLFLEALGLERRGSETRRRSDRPRVDHYLAGLEDADRAAAIDLAAAAAATLEGVAAALPAGWDRLALLREILLAGLEAIARPGWRPSRIALDAGTAGAGGSPR